MPSAFDNNDDCLDIVMNSESESKELGKKKKRKSMLSTKTTKTAFTTSTPKEKRPTSCKEICFPDSATSGGSHDDDDDETQSYDESAYLDGKHNQEECEKDSRDSGYGNTSKSIDLKVSSAKTKKSSQKTEITPDSQAFTNKDIKELIEKQKAMEEELKELKAKVAKKKKNSVVNLVRSCYHTVTQEGKDFVTSKSLFHKENADVVLQIRQGVTGLDSSIKEDEINEAIKSYYTSRKYYSKKVSEESKEEARSHQRKVHKLKKRKLALQRSENTSPKSREAIELVLSLSYMSSEDEKEDTFEVRPLRWRSKACDQLMEKLDANAKTTMSTKARRQTVVRTMGPFSGRSAPPINEKNQWAIRK